MATYHLKTPLSQADVEQLQIGDVATGGSSLCFQSGLLGAQLISIRNLIGKRAVTLYAVSVILLSQIGGLLTNWLLPNFQPVLDFDRATNSISNANALIIEFPEWLQYGCSFILIGYACIALYRWAQKALKSNA